MQQPVHLGRDLVGGALGLTHGDGVALAFGRIVIVLHHGEEGLGALGDALPMLVEELEKVAFPGQQPAEHHAPSPHLTQGPCGQDKF